VPIVAEPCSPLQFLRNPGKFKSCSAFAPIANPINCPWGQKAFAGYLGEDREKWKDYDSTELVRKAKGPLDILIDVVRLLAHATLMTLTRQGTEDNFYRQGQLLPEHFVEAAKQAGHEGVTLRTQAGYDHSYYFVSAFADDHIAHARKHLFKE
jgi:S-formylglutathione hydrolase